MITYPSITIDLRDGTFLNFTRNEIASAEIVEEINPVAIELPISTLEFTVNNSDNSFSMFNPAIYGKLREKLPISVYEHLSGDDIFIGTYYLDTWKNTTDRRMEFTAIDIIGVLANTDFDGIFWDTPVTLSAAMSQIFSPIGIEFETVGDIGNNTISGWIPPSTYRDALQQICFAARAMAVTARSNKIVLQAAVIPDVYRDWVVTKSQAKQNNIEALPQVARIEIISHNYSQSGIQETIFDKFLDAGNHKIVFEKPYYDIVVSGAGYEPAALGTEAGDVLGTEAEEMIEAGGDFTFGSNSVFITLTEAAQVVITGYAWLDSKRSFSYTAPNTENIYNKKNYLISNATLVNADRADAVLNNLIDYYSLRYLQDITFLPSEITVADIVLTSSINEERVIGVVLSSDINLTGGFLARAKMYSILTSYIPPMDNPVRWARTGVAITGADLTRNNKWRQYDQL